MQYTGNMRIRLLVLLTDVVGVMENRSGVEMRQVRVPPSSRCSERSKELLTMKTSVIYVVVLTWAGLAWGFYIGLIPFNPQGNLATSFLVATLVILSIIAYLRTILVAIAELQWYLLRI